MSEEESNTGAAGLRRSPERRAAVRRSGGGIAVTLHVGGTGYDLEIMDISELGFQAETTTALHAGQPVEVELPGIGRVRAVVRWGVGPYVGVEFERPVDVGALTGQR